MRDGKGYCLSIGGKRLWVIMWLGCGYFVEQKAEYEVGIGDWSSGVCSSDLKCLLCPLAQDSDGRVTVAPETFPVKPAKPARPQRYGTIFWLEREIGRASCRESACQYV